MTDEDDQLINQARAAGNRYIAAFNGDWDALLNDLNRRTEAHKAEGFQIASPPTPANSARPETKQRLPTP